MKRFLFMLLTLALMLGAVGLAEGEVVYPYTFVDEAGREVTINSEVKNVVVDYLPLWETLMLLDIKPVGASGADNYVATWDAFEGYDVTGITDIGNEVNLELVVALQLDLILTQVWDVSSYDVTNYEAIAPTAVFGPTAKMDWRFALREVGKLVGREDKAESVIADFESGLSKAKEEIADANDDQTVMQISVMGEGRYFIAYREDLYGENGLGLKTPEGYTDETNYVQIAIEAVAEMNPDVIFLNVFDGDEAILEGLQSHALWQNLDAYKNGKIYVIDGSGHASSALSTLYTVNFMVDKLTAAN